ncbi:MAG: DNA polymerase III subunit gamma/tau [Candidatus Eisenbacteria bacterium]|nr:DNA polymerase III subunit gamma/tau [Candidatus Eisenbacteria bacterium]
MATSYLVLARKWRPQRFDEVVGQRHVALTLTSALESHRLSHAYLFAGPRGVGKTSMARILAKALNCERGPAAEPCNECDACRSITEGHCLDVLEIDGASNRGIDDVRSLRESVKYAPASVRAKVYIIDEVHMLTTDAFNALLKTLEEPPAHVYFLLATTEPLKVPATILSRCQRHDFGRLTVAELVENLTRITSAEGIAIEEEALRLIARKAEGSVRDTLTLLDQVAAGGAGPFSAAQVQEILGLAGNALYFALSQAVVAGDSRAALLELDKAYREGLNLQELADELVHHFRNLLWVAMDRELAGTLDMTGEEAAELARQAGQVKAGDALRWLRILLDTGPRMRRSPHARVHLEVALAEMAALPRAVELARLLERLRAEGSPGETPASNPRDARRGAVKAGGEPLAPRPAPAQAAAGLPVDGRTPDAPASTASSVARASSGLQGQWEETIARLKGGGKAFLASCLHDSVAVSMEEGQLLVRLDDVNGFKREQLEQPANRRHILRFLEEVLGQPAGIRFLEEGKQAEASTAQPSPKEASPKKKSDPGRGPDDPGQGRSPEPPAARSAEKGEKREAPGSPDSKAAKDGAAKTARGRASGGGHARVREIADLMDGDIVGPAR